MSDQVCLNLNVALRSVTQAVMVLVFMFAASWRLTVVTFIIIPVILAISKVYGRYYRSAYHCSQMPVDLPWPDTSLHCGRLVQQLPAVYELI